MAEKPIKLAVVVPTRNRGRMAVRSVGSILGCESNKSKIVAIASDNSTDPEESAVLEKYRIEVGARMTLVRPSCPLPMTEHWNFAVERAMQDATCTHFMILTDRMLVREHRIREVLALLALFPDDVLSFAYDRIDDVGYPVAFKPLPRSGDVVRIKSQELLTKSARMEFPSCLPRMLNSVVSRRHLETLKDRFGSVFSSLSPDFSFCYRTLDACASILFYDRSVLVTYGLDRSNGNSMARGVATRDSDDFVNSSPSGRLNFVSPYPEFHTVGNAIVHEYLVAKEESRQEKFQEISKDCYLLMLATEVRRYADKHQVKTSLERLRILGWTDSWSSMLRRWRLLATEAVLGGLARRFDSIDAAITYAGTHEGPAWPWLPHPARGFGTRVLEKDRISCQKQGGEPSSAHELPEDK